MTLPLARKLLTWSFPHPRHDLEYILEIVLYYLLRNDCAYRCHRKRRLAELATWTTLSPSSPG